MVVGWVVLEKLLKSMGVDCTLAYNGSECVEAYKANPSNYDLILMDCRMPVMSGFQATMTIRKWEDIHDLAQIPIIALTATNNECIKANCLSVGMDNCLIKPINKRTLKNTLKTYASRLTNPETDTKQTQQKQQHILLAEDNHTTAKITLQVLEQQHYSVTIAKHGQEAFAKIIDQYKDYQLILMDIHMPVMNGIVCTKNIRSFERERGLEPKPIIGLLSNTTLPQEKAECQHSGFSDFANKPLDYPSLISLISHYI
eukprot:TRINITY_DN13986_c0_g1_i2.p1 TRINITY_DN13986_c0_g1~~TRINITY_DN13986_c0_g1_i2.p1  ORF type:complete len:257 (-),score=52.75 TRINITY_DN13986_c0_g1_i2:190-960(-)